MTLDLDVWRTSQLLIKRDAADAGVKLDPTEYDHETEAIGLRPLLLRVFRNRRQRASQ